MLAIFFGNIFAPLIDYCVVQGNISHRAKPVSYTHLMTTYKIGCGRLYTGKWITIDKSHMVSSFHLIGYKTA